MHPNRSSAHQRQTRHGHLRPGLLPDACIKADVAVCPALGCSAFGPLLRTDSYALALD